jgi:hypothetical protein
MELSVIVNGLTDLPRVQHIRHFLICITVDEWECGSIV